MSNQNPHQRMFDKDTRPSEKKILATIGVRTAKFWKQIKEFLKNNYDFKPEFTYYGRKYGWCFRYRRKNKTLCVLSQKRKHFLY